MQGKESQQFKSNLEDVELYVKSRNDPELQSFFDFLKNQYGEGDKNINIGSIYQRPITHRGVQVLLRFFYWKIEKLNLSMHKILDQGLQILIKHGKNSNRPLASLTELSLSKLLLDKKVNNSITSEGFKGLYRAQLRSLCVLMANNNKIDHLGMYEIVRAEMNCLRELHLSNNKIGKEGCRILMESKWKNFQKLDLNYNMIGNQGVHYLSEADWPQLTDLNLSNNKIDATGTFFMKNANWPRLKSLLMNRNQIGMQKGKITMIGCLNLCQLKTKAIQQLSLYGNEITLNAILMLLNSQKLVPKCFLELSRNHFKFQDIRETLKTLDKFCNEFEN